MSSVAVLLADLHVTSISASALTVLAPMLMEFVKGLMVASLPQEAPAICSVVVAGAMPSVWKALASALLASALSMEHAKNQRALHPAHQVSNAVILGRGLFETREHVAIAGRFRLHSSYVI